MNAHKELKSEQVINEIHSREFEKPSSFHSDSCYA